VDEEDLELVKENLNLKVGAVCMAIALQPVHLADETTSHLVPKDHVGRRADGAEARAAIAEGRPGW